MSYILVHDLGTTGDKAVIFDEKGRMVGSFTVSYPTFDVGEGGFEQNPADWLTAISQSTQKMLKKTKIQPSEIDGLCLSGHMMGVVALDGDNRPLRPAMLHSDIRSRAQVHQIRERISATRVHQITGNPLDVHYPWVKIAWLRDNEPKNYRDTRVFVQSKDYVGAWLTGEEPITDYSDGSLYGCFNFHEMNWSQELCDAAGISTEKLPQLVKAGTLLGKLSADAAKSLGLKSGLPVYVGFGDGASAALGAGAWGLGTCYNYVGSTSWVAATTREPVIDPEGRLFTIALTPDRFSSIGTVQCAGASWDWAVTRLCEAQFETAEALASSSPPGSNGLIFLPYLAGERSPIWNENARGVWFGLSSSHGASDLLRSVLEGVSLALASVLQDICRCSDRKIGTLRLIGGGVRNKLWRQILVASFGHAAKYPEDLAEATARGAFTAAALGFGLISSFEESDRLAPSPKTVNPDATLAATYEAMKPLFDDLYNRLEESFDDLAKLRYRLEALESENASV